MVLKSVDSGETYAAVFTRRSQKTSYSGSINANKRGVEIKLSGVSRVHI